MSMPSEQPRDDSSNAPYAKKRGRSGNESLHEGVPPAKKRGRPRDIPAAGDNVDKNRKTRQSKQMALKVKEACARLPMTEEEIVELKKSLEHEGSKASFSLEGGQAVVYTNPGLEDFQRYLADYCQKLDNKDISRHERICIPVSYIGAVQAYGSEDNFPEDLLINWNRYMGDSWEGFDPAMHSTLTMVRHREVQIIRLCAGSYGETLPGGLLMASSQVFGSISFKTQQIEEQTRPGHKHTD